MDDSNGDYTALFVGRLRRLLEIEQTLSTADDDPSALRFVHKAIFSTWMDCIEAGADAESAHLMGVARRPASRAA